MGILISWLVLTVALWVAAIVLPGVHIRSFGGAILVAAVYGLLNWFLGWIFFGLIGIATLGIGFLLAFLTRWIVSAIILKITDAFMTSLKIDGFKWAFLAALVMALVGTAAEWIFGVYA